MDVIEGHVRVGKAHGDSVITAVLQYIITM